MHTATGTDDELGVMYFASVDGVGFLPLDRLPRSLRDEKEVRKLIEGDGNFRPMLFHRDLLEHRFGAIFEEVSF